jgi:hypothetical protein
MMVSRLHIMIKQLINESREEQGAGGEHNLRIAPEVFNMVHIATSRDQPTDRVDPALRIIGSGRRSGRQGAMASVATQLVS